MHFYSTHRLDPNPSGPGNNGKEGVLRIPQSSRITGNIPSDCLVSYPGNSLGGVLSLCRGAVGLFYSPSRLGKKEVGYLVDSVVPADLIVKIEWKNINTSTVQDNKRL